MKRAVLLMGLSLSLLTSVASRADTIVTRDGRRISGEVTKADGGYTVKTKFGTVTVGEGDFSEWIKGDSTPAVMPPVKPVTPLPAVTPHPPTATTGKKADPKVIEALVKQGREALAAGEYKAARDAFHDAADADPKNADALHGLGLASMYLGDFVHALPPLEKALVGNPAPARPLVLNMGVCQIGQPNGKNAMRAAIILKDYLAAHSAQLDEPMLNALATALYLTDDQAKKGGKFKECEVFYIAYNAKLEAARPGMKRWGVQWMKAKEVDKRITDNAAMDRKMGELFRDMDALDGKIADKSRDVENAKGLFKRGFVSEYQLNNDIRELKALTDTMDEKQKAYDELMAKYERPTFPKAMTLVAMDDLTPPAIAPMVAVADAGPGETLIAPPRRVVKAKPDPDKTLAVKPDAPKPQEASMITVNIKPAEHRKVRISSYAAGFPVTESLVVTASAPVAGAMEIDLQTADGSPLKADLVRVDETSGLALLRVRGQKLKPLPLAAAFPGGAVQCAALPSVNLFNPIAELIPGTAKTSAADWKINLSRHPRLGGSPLLAGNKVIGVELATRDTDPALIPSASLEAIKALLGSDLPAAAIPGTDPCAVLLQVMATRETSGN